jgi:hypothetical protein
MDANKREQKSLVQTDALSWRGFKSNSDSCELAAIGGDAINCLGIDDQFLLDNKRYSPTSSPFYNT